MTSTGPIRFSRLCLAALLGLSLVGGCAAGVTTEFDADAGENGDSGDGGGDVPGDGTDGGDAETTEADMDGADGDGGDSDVPPRECLPERCGDGLDNDCDGEVDEECPCPPGEAADCFGGDPRHRGVGACRDGVMLCEGTFEFGLWGTCEGETGPTVEVCDVFGTDEDCNGAGNEGCECIAGEPDRGCGTEEGECRGGVQHCADGAWTGCLGSVGPNPEECNGADDDCDGATDEGLLRPCGSSIGACRPGYEMCRDGAWSVCEGANPPSDEVCDGLDNDCDGDTDEDVTRPCGLTVGRCIAGTETCSDGRFGPCEGAVGPIGEICNDVDDDCDGATDEGLVRPCGTDVGICVSGTETCGTGGWGSCSGVVWPGTELCDGLLDEDCDGTVDEDCGCTSGQTRSCGTDVGACVAGSQVCDSAGTWGSCGGGVGPTTETCNRIDDDCDGLTDEGCDCVTGETRSCGTDVGECGAGTETCSATGRWGPCLGATPPATEICNGRDDDCDGFTDEGDVCPRFPPSVTCPGGVSTTTGTRVTLTGSGFDPDGGPVTFTWTVVTRPAASTAAPSPANAAETFFTPDLEGTYTLRLCVTDDEVETSCCTVSISAVPACVVPSVPVVDVCPTSWDRRPILKFDALPSGIVYRLYKDADATPYATVSATGQNYYRPPAALGPGANPPGAIVTLYLRACRAADLACCSTSASVTTRLIEACTTPVAPTPANIVFSEYVIDGDGACPGVTCEAGEAIEITNLSHCPVSLNGCHFGYANPTGAAFRWMDFSVTEVIPPRGVYVAIRNRAASACSYPFFGPDDPGLFGLRISPLEMQGENLASGWFANAAGGTSVLRIATGAWTGSITGGTTIEIISPYLGTAGQCRSIGFNAVGRCGDVTGTEVPTTVLNPNQLGRLWHPCDAVVAPNPPSCR